MKKIQRISITFLFLVSTYYNCFPCKMNDSLEQHPMEEYFYNVKKFGAKGDGKTDDTEAIQKTINAAVKNGGTVFFPNGIYHIGGPIIEHIDGLECMSQLYIPHCTADDTKNIVFMGETAPEFELQGIINVTPSKKGAILYSSIVTDNPHHSLISAQKGPIGDWSQWNYTTPNFKDLGIRTCTMVDSIAIVNSLNGINLRFASKCHLNNVLIDTNSPLRLSINPSSSNSVGLITPEINNHALISIGLIRIAGYACGLKFSEHTVAKDIQIICCNVGMESEASHHSSSIQTFNAECCNYPIVFNPGHNVFVANYNSEHYYGEEWFQIKQDVTFKGNYYYSGKIVIGLCHPVVSDVGYDLEDFSTNDWNRVILLEKNNK